MNIRAMLTINTVMALLFGIGFLLLPGVVLPIFGMSAAPATTLMTQLLGAALIGIAVAAWLARDNGFSPPVRGLVIGLLIFNVLGFIVSLLAVLTGVTNALGWILPAALLIEALPRVYFLFVNPLRA
ncbi:MAG TPA: hypothetical protein VM536_12780 [Chloroflexia bacterium]|nr:hypothetical protein [Chloroflexia bacterium]